MQASVANNSIEGERKGQNYRNFKRLAKKYENQSVPNKWTLEYFVYVVTRDGESYDVGDWTVDV